MSDLEDRGNEERGFSKYEPRPEPIFGGGQSWGNNPNYDGRMRLETREDYIKGILKYQIKLMLQHFKTME